MQQSAAEVRDQAADKATELKDKAADKAGEVRGGWLECVVMEDVRGCCLGSAAQHMLGRCY